MTSAQPTSNETISSMTIAELTALIDERARKLIEREQKGDPQKGDPLLGGLVKEEILNKPYDTSARPLSEIIAEIGNELTEEDWAEVPTDASVNCEAIATTSEMNEAASASIEDWAKVSTDDSIKVERSF